LINPNRKVAYEGGFEDGLPHGVGVIYDQDGKGQTHRWNMGIDIDLL